MTPILDHTEETITLEDKEYRFRKVLREGEPDLEEVKEKTGELISGNIDSFSIVSMFDSELVQNDILPFLKEQFTGTNTTVTG